MSWSWAAPDDAARLAQAHALAFPSPWTAEDFRTVLDGPGVFGLLAPGEGLVICRVVADEAEVLTIGVAPDARRRGLAQELLRAALGFAEQAGAVAAFLEVAVDNLAAIGLYDRLGFHRTAVRKAYYRRPDGPAVDAFVMRLDLPTTAAYS